LASDYLSVNSLVYTWKEKIEAPAMLKRNGMYYMFGSHLTGWSANDNVYSSARSVAGPWSNWKNFAPQRTNTYQSQTTYVLPINNSFAVYMGDRWVEKDLSRSTYIWLPLKISGLDVSIHNYEFWDLSVSQGIGKPSSPEPSYSCKNALLKNGAKLLPNDSAGYIGGPQNGSVTFKDVSSQLQQHKTLKIYYRNGERGTRYGSVRVNDRSSHKVAFISTDVGNGIAALTVELKEGKNEIEICGIKNSWGPDIFSLKIASNS
jgi:hypothetical protein